MCAFMCGQESQKEEEFFTVFNKFFSVFFCYHVLQAEVVSWISTCKKGDLLFFPITLFGVFVLKLLVDCHDFHFSFPTREDKKHKSIQTIFSFIVHKNKDEIFLKKLLYFFFRHPLQTEVASLIPLLFVPMCGNSKKESIFLDNFFYRS